MYEPQNPVYPCEWLNHPQHLLQQDLFLNYTDIYINKLIKVVKNKCNEIF